MLPSVLTFIRLADPCVSSKPFMRCMSAGRNGTPGFRATDHKNTHGAAPSCGRGGVSLMFDEKIKVQWQFGDFVAAPLSLHLCLES